MKRYSHAQFRYPKELNLGARPCRIWSGEHGAWWGPDCAGYTDDFSKAGIYGATAAMQIVEGLGRDKKIALDVAEDVPIIFSAPMVQALLAGRKTQTRRLANSSPWKRVRPGDRLWVRENWAPGHADHKGIVIYGADGIRGAWMYDGDGKRFLSQTGFVNGIANPDLRGNWVGPPKKWHPSIHLPREYSRLTLTVTGAKIERLHNLTESDAIAEGIEYELTTTSGRFYRNYMNRTCPLGAYGSYASLWRLLHGDKAWDDNPEVVALTFEVHKANIDAMKEAA